MVRLLLAIFVVSLPCSSQWLSLGVTGGVPISPHSTSYGSSSIELNPSSSNQASNDVLVRAPNDFYQKPYAVGPSVEVFLPLNLSLQTGMLYERFHQDLSEGITPERGGGNVNFGYITSVAANAFTFPLLAKYTFARGRIKSLRFKPFVEGGATLRHLGDFTGEGLQLDFYLHANPVGFRFDPGKAVDVAITAGGGFRYRVAMVDVIPEIRYLRWTSGYDQPVRNQAMLSLTVAFPAKR